MIREKNISFYDCPLYSEKYNMLAFQAPYEIYIMPLNTKVAKLIAKFDDQVSSVNFFNMKKAIIYSKEGQ